MLATSARTVGAGKSPRQSLLGSHILECMQRVAIVGNSGSGKSTLGRAVATKIGAVFIEIDSIRHQADWEPLPDEEMSDQLDRLTATGNWVVDGNYRSVRALLWSRADTVIWLDLPRSVVMRQILKRTLARVTTRQELWNGNREHWRNFFSLNPEESVIAWSWTKHAYYRGLYAHAMTDPAYAHLRFIRLRSRREINDFATAA